MIASIFAMSENRVIGKENKLPWHLPADLKFFKATTLHHPILMGRKTYESIGKPLPLRTSVIITRQPDYQVPGTLVVNSLTEAINKAQEINKDIFIIGGAEILKEALPLIDTMYLTLIHATFEGDVYYPAYNEQDWQEVWREDHQPDEKNIYPFSFIKLLRRK
ncbi:dihydrofolate reductase [Adhaeribacter rhizoryzae]|uniref:Dihydrofolate reductase n=1 Tax=Adhaeribacter rhizoryzae TaxID=2607907 RepID=A0A5M6DAA6_9BACT|nr:dihydrofolate reductase [Adhaeribacter rhizoryzae]KAA5543456.1 dihydrofolate reductase [Adhaeribacter rhizoryzae]